MSVSVDQTISIVNDADDSVSQNEGENQNNEAMFKTSILKYISSLPSMVKLRLYSQSSTTLSIFRLLPSLGKFLIMGLLFQDFEEEENLDEDDMDLDEDDQEKSKQNKQQQKPPLVKDLQKWVVGQAGYLEFYKTLRTLENLDIFIISDRSASSSISSKNINIFSNKADESGHVKLNPIFQTALRESIIAGDVHNSFGSLRKDIPITEQVTIDELDTYAAEKWETILHFMVGTPGMKAPDDTVLKLLIHGEFMMEVGTESDNSIFTQKRNNNNIDAEEEGEEDANDKQFQRVAELKITNHGFQFLLQEINVQIWSLLLQYLKMSEFLKIDIVVILNFLFMISSLEFGKAYSTEKMNKLELFLLKEFANYGLLLKRPNKDWFYPTRMATILTSDAISIRTSSAAMNNVIDTAKMNKNFFDKAHKKDNTKKKISEANEFAKRQLIEKDSALSNVNVTTFSQDLVNGAVIIETNFKLYSYANSPLQIAILSLFVHLKSRFNNMVLGQITRDSIRRALRNGITAEQILAYLETHAHPQMVKLAEEQLEKKIGFDNMKKRQMDIESGKISGNNNEQDSMFKLQILPPTVVDQIKLWQIELDRVISADGYLYSEFSTMKEYSDLVKYCQDIGALVWKNDRRKLFFVEKESNDQVIEYAKRLISRNNQ
ncbi:hypothetical protein ACO0SA_001837 [Hanseniaspora valbyensis]